MTKRVLILGGTGDARKMAARLVGDGHFVVSSMAGVTSSPVLPKGEVRVGGFGGVDGLVDYITAETFDVVVDATHPFAAQISANCAAAAARCGLPFLVFERLAWQARVGDEWISARDVADAAGKLEAGAVAFVTIGRKEIGTFAGRSDVQVVARMIEPPGIEVPERWRIVLARPPFSLEDEVRLMRDAEVSVLVSKNAGGAGRAKLDAARALGLPVVMIERPAQRAGTVSATIEEVAAAVAGKES